MSGRNPFVEMILTNVFGYSSKLISLDYGLGLAAIGIITFFGVSLSSSIFEKYKDKSETTSNNNLISRAVIGKGIMRKAIAASLVMTYIVLIGLSFSAGTLDNPLSGTTDPKNSTNISPDTSTNNSPIFSNSKDVNINIVIKDIVKFDKIKVTTTNQTSQSIQELMLEKEPDTLVEHFTMVITVVIGFYFSSNLLTAYLKSRNEGTTSDDPFKILKVRLSKGDISEEEYEKLKALIEK
ncbi:MAG: SHOCT domain-containing protein [Thaumarchaeota archaeon]|nr:SHOCT domain-containing protein [Nitrososphaerota archaeon]